MVNIIKIIFVWRVIEFNPNPVFLESWIRIQFFSRVGSGSGFPSELDPDPINPNTDRQLLQTPLSVHILNRLPSVH